MRRAVLLLLILLASLSLAFVYMRPVAIFSCNVTLTELDILEKIASIKGVPRDFSFLSREKLAFLLKGIYLSELIQFVGESRQFPLALEIIPSGHASYDLQTKTLFLFFRRSKTVSDFTHDALLYKTAHKRGGKVYAGPNRLAQAAIIEINKIAKERNVQEIVIAGVSLGASIGAVVAEHMASNKTANVNLVLFNAFGIGDKHFLRAVEDACDNVFDVRNVNDVITNSFECRCGTAVLFDHKRDSNSANHCELAQMISAVQPDEAINGRAFYFSSECETDSDSRNEQNEQVEEVEKDENQPMSPLSI